MNTTFGKGMNIRELKQHDIELHFFELMAEIEGGPSFDLSDSQLAGWLRRKIGRRLGGGARFYGLFENDTPIGLMALIIEDHPRYAGYSELVDLGVFPAYRQTGHGTILLNHAEWLSREAGVFCMYISTYAEDTSTIAYYGKRGFAPVATIPDFHGANYEGQVYMRKRL